MAACAPLAVALAMAGASEGDCRQERLWLSCGSCGLNRSVGGLTSQDMRRGESKGQKRYCGSWRRVVAAGPAAVVGDIWQQGRCQRLLLGMLCETPGGQGNELTADFC